jgi:hypothetical protein
VGSVRTGGRPHPRDCRAGYGSPPPNAPIPSLPDQPPGGHLIQQHSLPLERIIDVHADHFARLRVNSGAPRPVVMQSQVLRLLARARRVRLAAGFQTNLHVATEQLVSLKPMSTGHQPAACEGAGIGQRPPGHGSPRSSDCADLGPRSTAIMQGHLSLPGPATAPVSPSRTLAVANRLRAVPLTDRAGLGRRHA